MADPACKKADDAAYYFKNREKKLAYQKAYAETNRDAINASRSQMYKRKRATDPVFRMIRNLRKRTWEAFRCQDVAKQDHTIDLLGCSPVQLRTWVERHLKAGMTWENYGTGWHLDHDIPCSAWDLSNPQHVRACFHHTNIMPMSGPENMSKGGVNRLDADYGVRIAGRLLELAVVCGELKSFQISFHPKSDSIGSLQV